MDQIDKLLTLSVILALFPFGSRADEDMTLAVKYHGPRGHVIEICDGLLSHSWAPKESTSEDVPSKQEVFKGELTPGYLDAIRKWITEYHLFALPAVYPQIEAYKKRASLKYGLRLQLGKKAHTISWDGATGSHEAAVAASDFRGICGTIRLEIEHKRKKAIQRAVAAQAKTRR